MGGLDEWLPPASAGTKTGLSIAQVQQHQKAANESRTADRDLLFDATTTAWIVPRSLHDDSFDDSFGMIKLQQTHRHFTLQSQRFDDPAVKTKVIQPPMQTRMKQPDSFSRFVDSRDIGAFISIAKRHQ